MYTTMTMFGVEHISHDADGAFIPADANNSDWQAYQAWRAAGNAPTPAPAARPAVPVTITDWQFMLQLALDGDIIMAEAQAYVGPGALPKLLSDAIAQLPASSTQTAQQVQAYATVLITGAHTFDRHNPNTEMLLKIIGKSDAEADALWIAASRLS